MLNSNPACLNCTKEPLQLPETRGSRSKEASSAPVLLFNQSDLKLASNKLQNFSETILRTPVNRPDLGMFILSTWQLQNNVRRCIRCKSY